MTKSNKSSRFQWWVGSPFLWCAPDAVFEVIPWTRRQKADSDRAAGSWPPTCRAGNNIAHEFILGGEPGRPLQTDEIRVAGLLEIGSVQQGDISLSHDRRQSARCTGGLMVPGNENFPDSSSLSPHLSFSSPALPLCHSKGQYLKELNLANLKVSLSRELLRWKKKNWRLFISTVD